MKTFIKLVLIASVFMFVSCKDMIQDSMYDKEYEDGKWNSSKWDRASWK